jgi:hypothetical protein
MIELLYYNRKEGVPYPQTYSRKWLNMYDIKCTYAVSQQQIHQA